jgi:Bacterial Ig-like domain/FG-GAP-like repeat
MKQMAIYSPRALLVWLAAAVVVACLMTLVGAKPAWAADRSFVPAPNSPLSVNSTPTTVTNADFNGDGKVDLAAQNANFITVSVLLGNGDGSFQSNHEFTVGFNPSSVISADFNGDTFADLAVSNYSSPYASILLGQDSDGDGKADGTFKPKQDFPVAPNASSVISADFNGDTFADLAVANYSNNTVSILLGQDLNADNKADGTFQAKQDFSIQEPCTGDLCAFTAIQAPNQVIAKDFNGDNKADLATANVGRCGFFSQPGGISVLLGNGNGTFQNAKAYSMGDPICDSNGNILQNVVPSITAADVNTDDKDDLAATIEKSNVVSVLRSNGDGTFSTRQDFAVGTRPSAVTGADLNNDTKADLAVSNFASDNVSILFNNGSGGFQAAQNFPAGDGPAFVVGADINADSFADLAVANQNSNNVSVLLNTTVKTAPAAPVISSPPEGGRVGSSFTVSGTAEPNSTVQLSEGTASKGSTTASGTGNWSILLSGITEGSHTYKAKATDTAGNTSAESNSRTVTVDTTASDAPVITSPAEGARLKVSSLTIAGTAEANSTVEVFEATASGDTSKGTTQVDASGAWTKTISGVSDGSHTYKAKAKDAAVNTSGFSNSRTVTVDTVKPQVSSTTPPTPLAGSTNVGRGTNLTATFSEKMRTSSINTTTFKLFKVNSDGTQTQITDVVVSLSSDGLKATLNPFGAKTTLLARNTKYKGVITMGTKDLAGNQLAQQKSWTFTTKP